MLLRENSMSGPSVLGTARQSTRAPAIACICDLSQGREPEQKGLHLVLARDEGQTKDAGEPQSASARPPCAKADDVRGQRVGRLLVEIGCGAAKPRARHVI